MFGYFAKKKKKATTLKGSIIRSLYQLSVYLAVLNKKEVVPSCKESRNNVIFI